MVTRIRQLLDSKELSPTQFADLIGVGRPVVSHILSERNKPSLEVVQRIIGAFPEISLPWLLSGTGSMLDEATASAPTDETVLMAALPTPPQPAVSAAMGAAAPLAAVQPTNPSAGSTAEPAAAPARPVAVPTTPAAAFAAKPAVVPTTPAAAATPSAGGAGTLSAPAAKPFRAPRFVPAAPAAAGPTSLPPTPSQRELPLPVAVPVTDTGSAVAASPTLATVPAASLPSPSGPVEAAMLPFLSEPGKAIRRIVIFYRDGSFADYQPEA